MTPNHLTPARMEILSWLRRNDGRSLADLYEGAIRLLSDGRFPGRFRFIGHAVREIRNGLPDVVAGKLKRGRLDYIGPMDTIANEWERAGFGQDGRLPLSNESDLRGPSGIPIPTKLFRLVGGLVSDHLAAREKKSEAAYRLYEAIDPDNESMRDTLQPIISQWLEVTEWFMKKTHDSGEDPKDFDEQELQQKFQIFEALLRGLARGFFSTLDELDEILQRTNS